MHATLMWGLIGKSLISRLAKLIESWPTLPKLLSPKHPQQ